ncbi:MAG: AAA family ATPase, partial [candidate division WOR-3 bacterium]
GVDKNICPVCEKETPNLLGDLEKKWDKKYKEQTGKIKEEIEKLKKDLKEVEDLIDKLEKLKNDFENAQKDIAEVNKKIEEQLKREITEKDDPLALLNKRLEEVKDELKRLEQSIKSRQEKLNDIGAKVMQIQVIIDVLNLEEKKKIVEEIMQTPEYKQMEEQKDKMAILLNDVDKIMEAINNASLEEAKNKINSAGNKISELFCKIANNPTVSKIELLVNTDRTGRNNYEFKDQNKNDLTPILSQGDLNALALSIFLGLSSLNSQFGFIMLDDPSQSLSSGHKENLIEILDNISEHRTVILATMDKELQQLASSKLTKAKKKYNFTNWTPESGPEVEEE